MKKLSYVLYEEEKDMKKISLLSLALLISCSSNQSSDVIIEEEQQETHVLDYSIVTTSIHWNEVFDQEEERYLIYFYSEYCGYCRNIKEEFLTYYLNTDDRIYFINAIEEKAVFRGDAGSLLGRKVMTDFYIPGTPFLLELANWTITNYYLGLDSIRMYIKSDAK